MKKMKDLIFIFAMIFLFASCSSDTTDKGTGNNTNSGSYATGDSDSTSINDTIHPAQPNSMDTGGEQTGRMNNTASGSRSDTSKTKK